MGCDDVINQINEIRRMFQSTHPHGVRQKHLLGSEISNSFNPRTRMGCDESEPDVFFQPQYVSIHAPAWGATRHSTYRSSVSKCFNPRTRTGCDKATGLSAYPIKSFQSTHPHGVRLHQMQEQRYDKRVSIHAPAWGATISRRIKVFPLSVSIHAPARGATYSDG